MRCALVRVFVVAGSLFVIAAASLRAQETPAPVVGEAAKPVVPVIPDEPKTVDPAPFMPPALADAATVEFKAASLKTVVEWLRDDRKLAVLLDNEALAELEVLPSDPVSDSLVDAPAYLLLNRLGALGLAWYFEDDVLTITSRGVADGHLTTLSHGVGDLLDAGYKGDALVETIESNIAPETWETVGGDGAVRLLGDVLFVRQRDDLQREVQGLLAALRSHGRRTFILDPSSHLALRDKLEESVSADLRDTTLEAAIAELSQVAGIDIRLHEAALKDADIRGRQPIADASLANRKLKTVLSAVLGGLHLTWTIRDGVLWITTPERAEESAKTAVYDVRDLCRDQAESKALAEAIMSQTQPEVWEEVGGPARLNFPRRGTMVITGEENLLTKVLDLLEAYRTALRASKPRTNQDAEANEVTTVYYRMHANLAESLEELLPKLVRPESWKSAEHPQAPGEITRVTSRPEPIVDAQDPLKVRSSDELLIARSVLIVTQTQAAHDELRTIIQRIENGDPEPSSGKLGGGMGGGGFGGGFFGVPSGEVSKPSRPTNR